MTRVEEKMVQEYKDLLEMKEKEEVFKQIGALLGWDAETKMPEKAVKTRSLQQSELAQLIHKLGTDSQIGELLKKLEAGSVNELGDEGKRNVELWRKDYDKKTKIPADLVAELTKHRTLTLSVWQEAKTKNEWSLFLPNLEKMVELMRKYAKALDTGKDELYDVLLDEYESGMTAKQYDEVFSKLKKGTFELMEKCKKGTLHPDSKHITKTCAAAIQENMSDELMKTLRFDKKAGRIDVSSHPFTSGVGAHDVRITTRINEKDFSSNFFSVAHEVGHGIYEQNLVQDKILEPYARSNSMGIHESQSRLVENMICRSPQFWDYFYPVFEKLTGNIFAGSSKEEIVSAINIVNPSKIRVEADEVTYNLHIILRFEVERALINGDIEVKDLPGIWNKKMKEYFGINIANDSEGVMQDIHWAFGLFGYFPTYSMGNIYAAQFMNTITKEIPNWETLLKSGDIKPITDWLTENIYKKGNIMDPVPLIESVTGEEPNSDYLLEYLNDKYCVIYGF